MRAGDLIQRITFQQKVVARNTFGDEVITWADQGTVWAQALPATQQSKEIFTADQPKAESVAIFNIRYWALVMPEWRLVWDGVVYEILSVQNVKGEFVATQILARTGVSLV